MLRTDSAYARSLSGRPIDDRLLREMQEAYRKVPENTEIPYSATEEYQKYARPYSEIHNFVLRVAGNSWDTISQADLYQLRLAAVEQGWKQLLLTDAEKGYLEKQEDSLEVPFVYGYDDGYTNYMSLLFTTGLLLLLGIAVCVPQIFSEEYSRKTDQLIASSPLGKKPLYLAKIFTGLTFGLGLALFLAGITAAAVFAVYGTDGFETAIQLDYPGLSWNITVGEAALILTGIYLLSALLLGSAAMLLVPVVPEQYACHGGFSGISADGGGIQYPGRIQDTCSAVVVFPDGIHQSVQCIFPAAAGSWRCISDRDGRW